MSYPEHFGYSVRRAWTIFKSSIVAAVPLLRFSTLLWAVVLMPIWFSEPLTCSSVLGGTWGSGLIFPGAVYGD